MANEPTDGESDVPVRLLLVDDFPANLLALEAVLEPLGFELVRAYSGAEALEKLSQQDFALVLMDVAMPVLDGFQTVEAIRKRKELQHLPVMFLTAIFKTPEAEARGYSLGAVDFIMKPLVPEIVRSKVSAFAALYRRNELLRRHQQRLANEIAARSVVERESRLREEFIAILGHDLRNPLNAVLMTAQNHGNGPGAPEPCREVSARIVRSAERMNRLINEVVDFARSRLGSGIPITRQSADMAEVCRMAIDELRSIHSGVQISFFSNGDTHGEWDTDRVAQVASNLIGNAIKHTNGRRAEIRVSLQAGEDAIAFQVHNLGPPIPVSLLEHMFEPFRRGEHRREGLGLGLYIAAQIVRAHGGTISAESSAESGTTFTVRWPRHVRPTAQPTA